MLRSSGRACVIWSVTRLQPRVEGSSVMVFCVQGAAPGMLGEQRVGAGGEGFGAGRAGVRSVKG